MATVQGHCCAPMGGLENAYSIVPSDFLLSLTRGPIKGAISLTIEQISPDYRDFGRLRQTEQLNFTF